jgi:putative membrane fusion protein
MRRFISISIAIFVIAGIVLYVMIFIVPDVENTQKKTSVIELGKLGFKDEITAYFVRDEIVYLADKTGVVSYYVGEGIKARKDVKILDIEEMSVPETTDRAIYDVIIDRMSESGADGAANATHKTGVVSYYIDGYEKKFSPERLDFLTYDEAEGSTGPAINTTRHEGDFARIGEPLYKIVDDSIWRLVFWLPTDSGKIIDYYNGERVTVTLPNGDITGKVGKVVQQYDMWMVVIEFDVYYENFSQIRKVNAGFNTKEYSGIIIDNASITVLDGKPGVYVKKKSGAFEFVPVKIKKTDGIKSAVWDTKFVDENDKSVSTVRNYDEILIDPAQMAVNEGGKL